MEQSEDKIIENQQLESAGIEVEKNEETKDITTPFDPKKVEIAVEQITIYGLAERIEEEAIDLMPDFQRKGNLWNESKMSQLIESILIRLPLPAIYMDVADDDNWIVVDGLQRLSVIKKFIVEKKLKLKGLEFLKELEGQKFEDLDKKLQRRIRETNVTLFKIKKGTPPKVLTSLFHRINTGGTRLTAQEIRNALNQGKASNFLKEIAQEEWFTDIIKISNKRMLDKEMIVRFMAFYRQGYKKYKPGLQQFLDEEMTYLNNEGEEFEINKIALKNSFKNSLILSKKLFGNEAFSKALIDPERKVVVNRSLFETTTVNFAKLTEEERNLLLENKKSFILGYKELLRDNEFNEAITANTNHIDNVKIRHTKMKELMTKHIDYAI